MNDPWRAKHFGSGYSAEFLPVGQHSWRIVKSGGVPIEFPSQSQALEAAKNAYLQRLEPPIRTTVQVDPDVAASKLEDKLRAEAESWLKSDRSDVQARETMYRAGKRPLVVMQGKA